MNLKIINVEEGVGFPLAHELTGITKKGKNIFLKGYIIKAEDIETLKNMGKYHIHILEDGDENLIHENEGAKILGERVLGSKVYISSINEGKAQICPTLKGILKCHSEKVYKVNSVDDFIMATKKNYSLVEKDEKVALCGITPLFLEKEVFLDKMSEIPQNVLEILEINKNKIGLITTGTEIFEGRIKDGFLDYVNESLEPYGKKVTKQTIVPDDLDILRDTLDKYISESYDLIFMTGGMSVDADDISKKVIREKEGMEVISYGSPVLPGAMFLMAYYGDIPVVGLPAGLLRSKETILSYILPLLLTEEKVEKTYINSLGVGGMK